MRYGKLHIRMHLVPAHQYLAHVKPRIHVLAGDFEENVVGFGHALATVSSVGAVQLGWWGCRRVG